MKQLVKLLRVKHWIKNTFLFIPSFFAGELFNPEELSKLLFGFFAFSLTASSIYVINDYKDIEVDKNHPVKKYRPLASGEVSRKMGIFLFVTLFLIGLSLGYITDFSFFLILLAYFILNLFYSFGLKSISILDIFIVSIGFVLRVKGGGKIVDVYVTEWLTIMIFLLSLFMALAKRRDDILIKIQSGMDMRKSVKSYNLEFVTSTLSMISGIIIVAYLIYTISGDAHQFIESNKVYYTSIFVLAGMMRYNQIIYVENKSGSPTDILYKDTFIILTLLGWALSFFFLIYIKSF